MSKKQKVAEVLYECPECDSTDLLVYAEEAWDLNTGEFFCHSVKTWDSNAKVRCRHCHWCGTLSDIKKGV